MSNNKFQSQTEYSFNVDNVTSKIRLDFDTNVVNPKDAVLGIDKTATQFILLDQSQVPGLGTNVSYSPDLSVLSSSHTNSVKEYVFEKLIDPSVVGCENCGDKRKYTPSTGVDSSGQITNTSVIPIINKEVIAEFQIEPEAYHSFEIDLVGHRTICDGSGNCFTENINDASGTTNINKRSWFSSFAYGSNGSLNASEANTLSTIFDPTGSPMSASTFALTSASASDATTVFPPFNSELEFTDDEYNSLKAIEYHCCKCCSYYEDFQSGKITEAQAKSLCEKSNIFIPSTGSSITHYDYCTTQFSNIKNLTYLSRKFSNAPISVCEILKDKINQYGTMPDPNIPQCNNISFNSVTPTNLTNPNPTSGAENIIVEEGELTIPSSLFAPCNLPPNDQDACAFCAIVIASGESDPCLDACQTLFGTDTCSGGGGGGGGGPDCTDPALACTGVCLAAGETEIQCLDNCQSNPCYSILCPYYNPCICNSGNCTGCNPACGDYNKCFYDSLNGPWSTSVNTVPIGYDIGIDEADPSSERISPCTSSSWIRNSSRHSTLLRDFNSVIVSPKAFVLGRCIEGPGDSSYNNTITGRSCTYLEDAILNSGTTNYCALLLDNPLYFNQLWEDTSFNVYGGGFYANRDLRDFIYDQTGTIHFTTNVNSNFLNYKPADKTNIIYHIEKIKSNNITYLLNYGNKPTAPAFYDNASAYLSLGYGYTSETVTSPVVAKQSYPVVKPYIYYHLPSQNYLSEYRTQAVSGATTLIYRTYYATYGIATNGGQFSTIKSVNTTIPSSIPVTETTYIIPSYSEENILITGNTSLADKSVLTTPVLKTKEIKKIYTQQNYGVMLWEDNSVTKDSFWGKLSTAMSTTLPSSSFVKNKYIDLSLSELLIMGVTTNNTLSFVGNDASIVNQTALNNLSGRTLLSVTHTSETNSNFAFVIVDDGTGQNKGTVRGWGTNNNGRVLGTTATNTAITGTATAAAELRIAGSILTDVVQIETNATICMALNSTGHVFVWGSTSTSTTNPWAGTNASNSNITLTGTGAVSPPSGRVAILGTLLTDVKKIACGTFSYAALKKDLKTLVLWGEQSRITFDGTPSTVMSKTITFTKNIADIQTTGNGGIILFEDGTVAQFGQQIVGTERAFLSSLKNIRSIADSNYKTEFYGLLKNLNTSGSFINEVSLNTWPETNQAFEYIPTARISRQLLRRGGDATWNGITWDDVYSSPTNATYPGLIYHSDITPINTLELVNGSRKRNNEISLLNNEYIFTYEPYESGVKTYKAYLINNGIRQDFGYITDSRDFAGSNGSFENFKFRGKILSDNLSVEISNSNLVYDSIGNLVAGSLPAKILSTILGSDSGNLNLNSTTFPIEVTINAHKFTGGSGGVKLTLNTTDDVLDDGTLIGSFSTSGNLNDSTGKITIILDRKFTRTVSGLNKNDVAFLFKVKNNVKVFTDSITYDKTGLLKTDDFSTFVFGSSYTYLDRPPSERARDLGRNEHELFTTKSARFATPDYASWDVTSHQNNSTDNQMVIPFRGLQYQYAKFKPGKTYGISAEVDDYPIIRTIRKNNGKFYIQILAGAFPYYHPLVHEPVIYLLNLNSNFNSSLAWRNAICNRQSNWFNYVATTKWSCHIKHTQFATNTLSWQLPQGLTASDSTGKQKPVVIGRIPPASVADILTPTAPTTGLKPSESESGGRGTVGLE